MKKKDPFFHPVMLVPILFLVILFTTLYLTKHGIQYTISHWADILMIIIFSIGVVMGGLALIYWSGNKDKKDELIINHDVFGELCYYEDEKNPEKSHFAGQIKFKNYKCYNRDNLRIDDNMNLELYVDISGPTLAEVGFFNEIDSRYMEISKSILKVFYKDIRGHGDFDYKVIDFQEEFRPWGIVLPKCENRPVKWQLGFSLEYDGGEHIWFFMMDEFEAKELFI